MAFRAQEHRGEAAMKLLLSLMALLILTACGSGGPTVPDWKSDSVELIERYKKHALLGEITLAERYFQQANER